jgi:hypothetical protein
MERQFVRDHKILILGLFVPPLAWLHGDWLFAGAVLVVVVVLLFKSFQKASYEWRMRRVHSNVEPSSAAGLPSHTNPTVAAQQLEKDTKVLEESLGVWTRRRHARLTRVEDGAAAGKSPAVAQTN